MNSGEFYPYFRVILLVGAATAASLPNPVFARTTSDVVACLEKSSAVATCLTEAEIRSLGIAEWMVLIASNVCPGAESQYAKRNDLFNRVAVLHLEAFGKGQGVARERFRSLYDQIKKRGTDGNSYFCREVANDYGPQGKIWPQLYEPHGGSQ